MYDSFLWEKDCRLFLKDADLHITKNIMASQEEQDVAVFLHKACESCYYFPGHWKDHRQKQQK